jgi:hypothetical protein
MPSEAVATIESWHGSISGYVRFKCRCGLCKTEWAEYSADWREWRKTRGKVVPGWRSKLKRNRKRRKNHV